MDRQTDELIRVELGNQRFLQVNYTMVLYSLENTYRSVPFGNQENTTVSSSIVFFLGGFLLPAEGFIPPPVGQI